MSGFRGALALSIVVSAAGLACGSTVTTETTQGGGDTSTAGSGGTGGTGGVVTGGTGGVGPTGGATTGGSGGVSVGGSGGVGPTGGSGGAIEVCPGLGDACTDCMSDGCSTVWCNCVNQPHCGGYFECVGTCMGDMACLQNCATVHQDGIAAAILVSDCAATTCDGSCNFGQPLAGCPKCLYTECPDAMNACIGQMDGECIALIQCFQMCMPGDMMCGMDCVDAHPDGLAALQAIQMCQMNECDAQCP